MKTLLKILGFAVAALIVVALGFYFIEVYAPSPANPTLSAAIQQEQKTSSTASSIRRRWSTRMWQKPAEEIAVLNHTKTRMPNQSDERSKKL